MKNLFIFNGNTGAETHRWKPDAARRPSAECSPKGLQPAKQRFQFPKMHGKQKPGSSVPFKLEHGLPTPEKGKRSHRNFGFGGDKSILGCQSPKQRNAFEGKTDLNFNSCFLKSGV